MASQGDTITPEAQPQSAEPFAGIHIKLPPFWVRNPEVRFLQVEAQFQQQRITSQNARYLHVVSSLPADMANDLHDVLARPPESGPYDHLKEAILNRKTESESSRFQQLLTAEELGDRRPSQLLRRMRQLMKTQTSELSSSLIREMFLQRLPQSMVMVLAAADDISLTRLAELADRVSECSTPVVYLQLFNH